MSASSQTTGGEQLIERFRALAQAARTRIAREALEAGAAVVLEEQQARAAGLTKATERTPKSTALALGLMREDLRMEFERVDAEGYESCLIGPGNRTWYVAVWVEYGHRLVKGGYSHLATNGPGAGRLFRGSGREVGEVPPEPFLRPAFETAATPAVEAVNKREWQIIQEVLG